MFCFVINRVLTGEQGGLAASRWLSPPRNGSASAGSPGPVPGGAAAGGGGVPARPRHRWAALPGPLSAA